MYRSRSRGAVVKRGKPHPEQGQISPVDPISVGASNGPFDKSRQRGFTGWVGCLSLLAIKGLDKWSSTPACWQDVQDPAYGFQIGKWGAGETWHPANFFMSLQFFFNRKGLVVRGLLAISWLLQFYHAWLQLHGLPVSPFAEALFWIYLGQSLTITAISYIPWNRSTDRGHGIENHFSKTLIPLAYMMMVASLVVSVWPNAWPLLLFVVIAQLPILGVDVLMLAFHFQDKDSMPASYFARNLHLLVQNSPILK